MIAFPNTKILPVVEVLLLQGTGSPRGPVELGEFVRFPHLGAAGLPPSLPAFGHLLLPQNSGNVVHFNSWLLPFSQIG